MLQTTYFRIRRYATGDPYNMCRFVQGSSLSKLDKHRSQIIDLLKQNLQKTKIFDAIVASGYTGKKSALHEYCRKLVKELSLPYTPKKNTIGVIVKSFPQDTHSVTSTAIFKNLWSGKKLESADKEYLFNKYPALTELEECITHFRQIYQNKDPKLLDEFVALYSKSKIKYLASFANGMKSDLDAVINSVISPLSNGFVEGNINRLKTIKRVMCGRADIALLEAKVVVCRPNSVYTAYG
jgi:hypothetical protein